MNSLRYTIVPWVAPASAAGLMGVTFFRDYYEAWGWIAAGLVALLLAASVEWGGQYVAKGLALFIVDRAWVKAGACVAALAAYALMGVNMYLGTPLWGMFIFLSLFYIVVGLVDTRTDKRAEGMQDAEIEIRRMNVEKNLTNARRREIEAGLNYAPVRGYGQQSGSGVEQHEQTGEQVPTSKQPVVWAWLDENFVATGPQKTKVRDICDGTGINSTSTCGKHFRSWKAARGK